MALVLLLPIDHISYTHTCVVFMLLVSPPPITGYYHPSSILYHLWCRWKKSLFQWRFENPWTTLIWKNLDVPQNGKAYTGGYEAKQGKTVTESPLVLIYSICISECCRARISQCQSYQSDHNLLIISDQTMCPEQASWSKKLFPRNHRSHSRNALLRLCTRSLQLTSTTSLFPFRNSYESVIGVTLEHSCLC